MVVQLSSRSFTSMTQKLFKIQGQMNTKINIHTANYIHFVVSSSLIQKNFVLVCYSITTNRGRQMNLPSETLLTIMVNRKCFREKDILNILLVCLCIIITIIMKHFMSIKLIKTCTRINYLMHNTCNGGTSVVL